MMEEKEVRARDTPRQETEKEYKQTIVNTKVPSHGNWRADKKTKRQYACSVYM